jgi:hypothetical protein
MLPPGWGASHESAGSSNPQCGAVRLQGGLDAFVLNELSSCITHSLVEASYSYAAQ